MLSPVLLPLLASVVLAQAPSYAPIVVDCPSTSLLERTGTPTAGNQTLHAGEAQYLQNRRQNVLPQLWTNYLNDNATGSTGYTASQIVAGTPSLGIAVSGGGLRASLYGAGTISALDSRNSSTAGGLLQLADYLTGLSGGSWTVTSIALNDMEEIYPMVTGVNSSRTGGWMLDKGILDPSGLLGFSENSDYYNALFADVQDKANAGFPISLTDVWGRALALHFLNGTTESNFYSTTEAHDQGTQFSSIRLTQNFQAGAMPFPLLVTTSRVSEAMQLAGNSTTVLPLSNTQFEITPYSFGSFDATLSARIPIEYLGTQLSNGVVTNSCINYFEAASFMMGSSASLFNSIQEDPNVSQFFDTILTGLLSAITDIKQTVDAIALVGNYPNSFGNFTPESGATFESSGNSILQITDGGENGENVPISPLLVKAREVDIILAIDSSADTTYYWPNGTSLLATAERSREDPYNFTSFPPMPTSQQEFIDQGLNTRPTFFGCNSTFGGFMNASGAYPIVVYLPNAPAVTLSNPFLTNTSTYTLSYEPEEVVGFLDSAHANAIKGFPDPANPTVADSQYATCLKCATVDRARQRLNISRSATCESCFTRYCWSDAVTEVLTNATTTASGNTPAPASSATSLRTAGGAAVFAAVLGLVLLA